MKRIVAIATLFLLHCQLFAQPNADSLKRLLRAETDNFRKADLALQLCEIYKHGRPDSCLLYAEEAIDVLSHHKDDDRYFKAQLYIAIYNNITGKPDVALTMIQQNLPRLEKRTSPVLGLYYTTAGLCLMKLDKKKEALDHFYAALRAAEKSGDNATQLKAYVNIGWVMMELNQFENAIPSFLKAIAFIEEKKLFDIYSAVIYNNLASCYGSLGMLDSTLVYARFAIDKAKSQNDKVGLANGLFILGGAQTRLGQLQEALQTFLAAEPVRQEVGDPFFIVSDQAEIAILYAKLGRPKEGIAMALKALETAQINKIDAKLPMIYTALADNYAAGNDYEKAIETHKKISDLKDSMYTQANAKALAEMNAKYEAEKRQLIIEKQKSKIAQQNLVLMIIVVFILAVSLLAYSYYKRFKLKKEAQLQAEIIRQQDLAAKAVIAAEEEERQRIARDLHDGVGQMMSAAKMNLSAFESETHFDSEEQRRALKNIIGLVDNSCKEVRHTSHNMMPNALLKNNLADAIRDFTDKIDRKALEIHLYTEGLDEKLDTNTETVLYRVIQECVNNVIKHSGASTLDISIVKENGSISATIEDNGKGFDTTDTDKLAGIGLKNIISRVEYLKGTVEFDSAPGKGAVVSLHVPVSANGNVYA